MRLLESCACVYEAEALQSDRTLAVAGRVNVYDAAGRRVGRLKGGKGQVFEGGIRMPAAVVWPGVVQPGRTINTFVTTADIFPTVLAAANVDLGPEHTIDGKDMGPILRGVPRSNWQYSMHHGISSLQ